MANPKRRNIVGWIVVGLSVAIACVWAYWGINENFHEGWYHRSLLGNLGLMFAQYLSPMLAFMGLALLSIYWPRLGAGLHAILAAFLIWFFRAASPAATFLIITPLLISGAMYWYGRPRPRRLAMGLVIGLPLLTLVGFGIAPAVRVSQRVHDGDLGARFVEGNGVSLTWAPAGPGWPSKGMDWYAANEACQLLTEDGAALSASPVGAWRLPTAEEAVRSMARHGLNSGGVWDAQTARATYQTRPDKESPLWDVYSPVIYWWTATDADEEHAYIIVYDGKVWPRSKSFGPDYLGFRCVK